MTTTNYQERINSLVEKGIFPSKEAVTKYLAEKYLPKKGASCIVGAFPPIEREEKENGKIYRNHRSQREWTNFLNKKGKVMIALPHIYNAGKFASKEFLNNFREKLPSESLLTNSGYTFISS